MPARFEVIHDIDIDLELGAPHEPGFSRRPDLIVVERVEVDRVNGEGGVLRASAVQVVVEIVSPGSRRIDNDQGVTGTFTAKEPFPVTLDLDQLR